MEAHYCSYCSDRISANAVICLRCGSRTATYFPLIKQNFIVGIIVSIILTLFIIALCLSPVFIKNGASENILPILTASIAVFGIWEIVLFARYLKNFFELEANIFINIQSIIVCIPILAIVVILNLAFELFGNIANITICVLIVTFVLWLFLQILTGKCLSESDSYDFVGGLPNLGFMMILSGIVPLLMICIPIIIAVIFFRARKYTKQSVK